ncbi:competence protein ComEC [Streptomyces sp. 1222.5]|uniref:ComEC/Rec2 family competence protein n=1 Tax=unclassified Streptomyces TaxID=2593676 RepID=UPI00089A1F71|nr:MULTISPECIES: ComEC/Rec2 family competence protein [unclassified Streptomyces]PKW07749.1 competence protein ComEC [Streptomyces sp. 5112.2]SEC80848.1 competence protein ComEC [Streptomyces sp. 1222.5]
MSRVLDEAAPGAGPEEREEAGPDRAGPLDLRLVPPALAAWATAASTLDAPASRAAGLAAVCLVGGLVLLCARGIGQRRTARTGQERTGRSAPVPGASPRTDLADPGERAGGRFGWARPSAAAVLLCVAAAAASAGLHGADLRRGPVPELARRFATVTAEVELSGDPWLSRPRVRGDRTASEAVLIRAEVRRVEESDGTGVRTRTPVLLVIDADVPAPAGGALLGPGAPGSSSTAAGETPGGDAEHEHEHEHGDGSREWPAAAGAGGSTGVPSTRLRGSVPGGRAAWLGLLPSTRLRVGGRLAPALTDGDRTAAVLRVRGRPGPRTVAGPSGPQRLAGRLRAGLRQATDGLPGDARALLPGLVVGDTARITPELDGAFKETDLAHTLAVSGSNLTVLLALLIGPPGLAQLAERRGLAPRLGLSLRATALSAGALTLAFVVVCRPDPSVLRAAACGAVALLALATGRRRSLVPALAAAVLLLVLYDPWLSRSYGFLLSVLATGALLVLAPGWTEALRRHRVPPRLAEALGATAAAQAVCAPVVAVLSARVSLVAVPCNLLAEAAVAPATVLGFAALASAQVAMPAAKAFAWCASWPAGWIAGVARTGAALPGAGVDWPGSWAGALLLAAVTVAVVLTGRRLLRRPWWCGLLGLLLLLAVVRPAPLTRVITGWPPPDWRFAMCDVGQGDATVLAAGEGAGIVVDAGPDPAPVDHCLRHLGITRIPLLVLTHFHADHVAGLPGVLRGRSVAEIETTGFEEPAGQAAFVRREAAARHIPVTRAVAGEERRSGPLAWRVLWPPPSVRPPPGAPAPAPWPGAPPEPDGPNDASVALLVRTGGMRLLLLGDLEPPAQQALLRSPAAADLAGVDVLKVAHHGSAYQEPELMRLAAPRVALVSAGADNPYGHPAPSTLAALRSGGAVVLRTDRDGALAVTRARGAGGEVRVTKE